MNPRPTHRRTGRLPSRTSLRLIVGFLIPLAAFAVAAILSMRYMEGLVKATDTIRRLQRGLEAALHIQNLAHELDAAQADMAAAEELINSGWFESVGKRMLKERQTVGDVLETDREREKAWKIRRLKARLDFLFHDLFVPAVANGDRKAFEEFRRVSRQPFDEIVTISKLLVRDIQKRIQAAGRRAEEIRVSAVRDSGLLLGASVVLAVIMALITSRAIAGPIQTLIDGAAMVGRGRLDHVIDLPRRDEFGRLARSFNRMTAELAEHQRSLVQARKMASLGRLAAGVAHEINNPISVILGYARVLAREEALDPRLREDLAAVEEEARQCKRIVDDLLDLARPAPAVQDDFDLAQLLRDAADRVARLGAETQVEVVCEAPDAPLPLRGDRDKIRQILDNLARNAVEAMPDSGRLTFRVRRESADDGQDHVAIEVTDTGVGMSEEQVERIFDPFYSNKTDGTGLGLSIVYGIVQAHRGRISVRSRPGQGTTFTILIPDAARDAS